MRRWRLMAAFLLSGACLFGALAAFAADQRADVHRGKKILWINSYHAGYPWGDGIGRGIRQRLAGSGVELKTWYMDTNRNRSEAYARQAARLAQRVIEEYRPDVLIASDDNAQKFLVVPYLKESSLPVVFCGVNRELSEYGYPRRNLTGMRGVNFAEDLVRQMRNFAGGERKAMISGDTETARIFAEHYQRVLGGPMKVYLVKTFAEFKEAFLRAQQEADMLCLRNNAGIQDWEDRAAERFLAEQTRIPTGSVNPWMKQFVIFNLASFPEEQGEFAADAALRILAGTRPEDIPVTQNRHAHLTVNLKLAEAAGIVLPVSLLRMAEVIGLEALNPSNEAAIAPYEQEND